LLEFAIAEHVRSLFPHRSDSGKRQSILTAVAAAAALAQHAYEKVQESETMSQPVACRAGCSYCCHMRVVATVPEIVFLYDYIVANLPGSEIAALRQRVVVLDAKTRGLTDEQWGVGRFPCPMLVDGMCSAYAARPLDCRGYNSTSIPACRAAAEDYLEWDVPMDRDLMAVNKSAQAGLLQGLTGAGYRPRLVELTAALGIVFEDPTAIERWLKGENPFACAELDLSDPEQRAFLPWVPSDDLRAAVGYEELP
jgi:Fe-S-cluster containining protein